MRGERGSGSLLAVAVIAATIAVVSLLVPLAVALSGVERARAAADASALAAADVAVGISPGVPCESAAAVAAANGARLDGCSVDGAVDTGGVAVTVLGLGVRSRATAGPPGGGSGFAGE
jgi:secretion/DNA translocation related TadE-like protein